MVRAFARLVLCAATVLGATAAEAVVTVHRSFRGGLPTSSATARTATGFGTATTGTRATPAKTSATTRKVVKGAVPEKVLVGKFLSAEVASGVLVATVRDKNGKDSLVRFDRLTYQAEDIDAQANAVKLLDTVAKDKAVEVRYDGHDVKGRIQGIVFVQTESGRVDLNLTVLRNGWARHDVRDKTPVYLDAEAKAKAAKMGLWTAGVNP